MNNLRPTSVCDTTPLQRLESQSSSSEPSSPILSNTLLTSCENGENSISIKSEENMTASSLDTTSTLSVTTSHHHQQQQQQQQQHNNNNNNNNNNNKMSLRYNYINTTTGSISERSEKQKDCNNFALICKRIFWHFVLLICVALPVTYFHYWGEPYKRGFFCDDTTLRHPYKESTIRSWQLYFMGFVVPVAIIVTVEFFKSNYNRMHGFDSIYITKYYISHMEIPDWIVEIYKKLGTFIFGVGIGQLITDIGKFSIGRLRPHFFAVCQPIMPNHTTCNDPVNIGRYIEDFTCLGYDATPKMLKEMRLSFPSGHANFAFFTMVYLAIYLQIRLSWQNLRMFKHLLQVGFIMFAWYTAMTRVSDYKHHWSDVLAGSLSGTTYAFFLTSTMW